MKAIGSRDDDLAGKLDLPSVTDVMLLEPSRPKDVLFMS